MGTKTAVAGRIGRMSLDDAFLEAEARSLAGQTCEIWCHRDPSGRPVAYRVLAHQQGRPSNAQWERLVVFLAVGTRSESNMLPKGMFPKSA